MRTSIENAQASNSDEVAFSESSINAQITSKRNETFAFTDLPGIFLVSEQKLGADYASSRAENEKLKESTLHITKKYMSQPNTIVLVVVSSTDWMHGMNNDNLISYLAEWLEDIRKDHPVPVYGVITKLDTQDKLGPNSIIKKLFSNTLPKEHILNGLQVKKWLPLISSREVLSKGIGADAAQFEREAIHKCLKSSFSASALAELPVGRSALLSCLKGALLDAIHSTHGTIRSKVDEFLDDLCSQVSLLPLAVGNAEKRRIFDHKLMSFEGTLKDLIGNGKIGNGGRHGGKKGENVRSFRMQLMADAPAKFDSELTATQLRGDVLRDVELLIDQAALEQGGNFDSDVVFDSLSSTLIQHFKAPCMGLVNTCANVVASAMKETARIEFGSYPQLEALVQSFLGINADGARIDLAGDIKTNQRLFQTKLGPGTGISSMERGFYFPFLVHSARGKVLSLLDAMETMICFHPMWRNFDLLYTKIIMKGSSSSSSKDKESVEQVLQDMMNLEQLTASARKEGEHAIDLYEVFQSPYLF